MESLDLQNNRDFIPVNKYQTQITAELLETLHKEVKDELIDLTSNVEYIKRMISPSRKYASDLNKDSTGRIIIDLANPHILVDMDYFRPTGNYYRQHGVVTKLRPNANPNSEFGKWISTEIDRIWNGMVREYDGEWIPGQMYFYLNYMPIIQTKIRPGTKIADRIVDFPEVWDGVYLWFHYLEQARNGGLYNNFEGGQHGGQIAKRGASKAHPYSQHVYTPNGIKRWSEINIGDLLFGDNGQLTTVIDIPFNGFTDIYKVTTRDGRTIYASEDHLWKVYQHGFKEKAAIKSTKELLVNYKAPRKISDRNPNGIEFKYGIPVNGCVDFISQATKIDPYTFGLLLGDGSFRGNWVNNVYFTSEESDMETYKKHIPYKIKKWNTTMGYGIEIPEVSNILKEYGLFFTKSEGKFIPDEYKFNSKEVRLNILQGLMDSDGYIGKNGIPTIGLSSKRMIEDIAFIARSLGYNCRYTKQKAGYKKDGVYIPCLDTYVLSIFTNDFIFKLDRKNNKLTQFKSAYSRSNKIQSRIINIEYSHKEMAKCVTVDNESHCYLIGDFVTTHNSYTCASMMSRLFICGDNKESCTNTRGVINAADKEKLIKDGTLNKFVECIDFCAEHTQFPSQRLKSSLSDMTWVMGYMDSQTLTSKGTNNTILGVTVGDDTGKSRGKRSNLFLYEEFGAFPKFIDVWNTNFRSVQEGNFAFGQAVFIGTGGEEGNDFAGALEMIYNPVGYNVYALPNIYDRNSQGKQKTIFFFGACVSRKGFYDKDGNSDIVGALIEILTDRVRIKYNSTDPMSLTRAKAEDPITLQEAIMKRESTIYPVSDLTDRINELDFNPRSMDDVLVGRLSIKGDKVVYEPDSEVQAIREFPHKDNKLRGAIEIHQLPKLDHTGQTPRGRYIAGIDTFDDDESETLSLGAIKILDLYTDELVFEYAGRDQFADDFYEICRRALLYYNAEANYENNKKGLFTYFSKHNCLYLLSDTLEFLKDKEMMRYGIGNKSKGTISTAPIKGYYRRCIRDYLLKPVNVLKIIDGEEVEVSVARLFTMKSRALLKELTLWSPDGNYDRHDAFGMLMLIREDKLRLFGGNTPTETNRLRDNDYLGNDPFFNVNYRAQ